MNRRRFSPAEALLALLAVLTGLVGCGRVGSVALPDVLYLRPDENGRAQLIRQAGATGEARQLTAAEEGEVIDFAASPNGGQIIYALATATGSFLRIANNNGSNDTVLLACPGAECSGPVWSPDGQRVLYERRELSSGVPGSPRLYWLDPAGGETLSLIAGDAPPSYGARFSPDGAWLSYVSPGVDGVVLYELASGDQRLLSSRVGRPAAFNPASDVVIIGDLVLAAHDVAPTGESGSGPPQESSSVYLYRVTLREEGRERLSPEAAVDDSVPAWSPDGQWIAFGRAPADAAAGRQLWLMRPDGHEARALTNEPALFHGPPAWSPDGAYLLYQRYDVSDPTASPSVWLLRLADGAQSLVAADAFLPAWLPPGP